jgi:hypothetical protein
MDAKKRAQVSRRLKALRGEYRAMEAQADKLAARVKKAGDLILGVGIRKASGARAKQLQAAYKRDRAALAKAEAKLLEIEERISALQNPATWSAAQEAQYKAIEKSEMKRGATKKTAKRIAAATVNKRGANPSPAQIRARKAFAKMAKERAKAARAKNSAKRSRNPRYLITAVDSAGKWHDLGILQSPNKMQAVRRAKTLYKSYKRHTAQLHDKGDFIGRGGVVKVKRRRTVKGRAMAAANPRGRNVSPEWKKYRMDEFQKALSEMTWRKGSTPRQASALIDKGLDAGISPIRLKRAIGKQIGIRHATRLVNERLTERNPKKRNSAASKAKGVLKSAGKAIKKVGRSVLTGVSKVAGKGARALKNPKKATIKRIASGEGWDFWKIGDDVYRAPVGASKDTWGLPMGKRWESSYDQFQRYRESVFGWAKPVRNPSATSIRRKFAGRVNGSRDLYFPKGAPNGMAKLGRFVSIKLKGGKVIKPARRNPAPEIWLCSDTKGRLWLGSTKEGALYYGPAGNLGEVSTLEYQTSKPHLGEQYKKEITWFHHMGENGGTRPTLHSDGEGGLLFKGGSYKIRREGIVR